MAVSRGDAPGDQGCVKINISLSAAQHEAERESRLRDEKNQVWIPREGLAQWRHTEGLCVSLRGHRGSTASDLWPSGLLHSSDRPAVGALLHQHHGGGAVCSERRKEPLRSAARRPREVKSDPDTAPHPLHASQENLHVQLSLTKNMRTKIAKGPFESSAADKRKNLGQTYKSKEELLVWLCLGSADLSVRLTIHLFCN